MTPRASVRACVTAVILSSAALHAHDGPPFPIVSDRSAGPYLVSIWTDPDTTDDGTAGGQFWVRLRAGGSADALPPETRATVTVRPTARAGPEASAIASPVRGDVTNQFAAVVMNHEGPFAVHVDIAGPLGSAVVDSAVDATYDLRPGRPLILLYLAPFVIIGLLWGQLLLRRSRASRSSVAGR